jgi:penicillin-binding protein 2
MILINRSPKSVLVALVLFVLTAIPFSTTGFAKHRHGGAARARHGRAERGRKGSARERRGSRRHGRLSARATRRGRRTRLSGRELRAARRRVAGEQASAVKALERKLHRPLTKRERAAEMRRVESKHRRELEVARRRAEAARRAAIARQRALDQAARAEAQSFISRDDSTGEDAEVRRVAINALGSHAGTVVVMDPKTGRVYTIVNQEWALRRGFKPCSTIKLVTGLAGLNEKVIDTVDTQVGYRMDLTEALAHSNNTYFQQVGGRVGFDKMVAYARELGLGQKTGINEPNEFAGSLPVAKTGYAVNHMSSHGDDFAVTAVQLATLVSAMANGGKLLKPYVPRSLQEQVKFAANVRREIGIEPNSLQRMVPGMVGAVNYGSGKRAYDPLQTVAGKTGTCIGDGGWLGLFTSYAPLVNPRLAVVVIARRADAHGHFPAAVAGQIYRDLNQRFGTPTNLPIAATPGDGLTADPKAADDEESKEAAEQRKKEEEGEGVTDTSLMNEADNTSATTAPKPNSQASPANSKVKRVLMPLPKRTEESSKPASGSKTPPKNGSQTEERPRKVSGSKP